LVDIIRCSLSLGSVYKAQVTKTLGVRCKN
jgi:hypothetical protein